MTEPCEEHGLIGCRDAACYTAPKPAPRPQRSGFRRGNGGPTITAEYRTPCEGACADWISPGEPIVAVEEMRPLGDGFSRVRIGWRHDDC